MLMIGHEPDFTFNFIKEDGVLQRMGFTIKEDGFSDIIIEGIGVRWSCACTVDCVEAQTNRRTLQRTASLLSVTHF